MNPLTAPDHQLQPARGPASAAAGQPDAGLAELYAAHLEAVGARTARALAATGYDGVIVPSGSLVMQFADDQPYPFKANPQFKLWIPEPAPDCCVIFEPGRQPVLVFHQPVDYWHKAPELPPAWWASRFDLRVVRDPTEVAGHVARGRRWAVLGPLAEPAAGLGDQSPAGLLARLDWCRAAKTPYELECLRRASRLGARAHGAAEAAFRAGASEYEVHLAYCRAAMAREEELPYNNIVAFGANGAVLHYQHLERSRPAGAPSLLIDAGAPYRGYGSDITRTYSAADDEFAALVAAVDVEQQAMAAEVRPGADYAGIHLRAHDRIARVLAAFGLVRCTPEAAVATGLTSVFFPHGIGHLLGLQVHDVAGLAATPEGGERARPPGHPYLRLTRTLEPGTVVTIEPGLYFIDQLLQAARAGGHGEAIDWDRVGAFRRYGGIRIEDNVAAMPAGPENLTRAAFATRGA